MALDPNMQAAIDGTLLAINNVTAAVLTLTQERDGLMIDRDNAMQQLQLATQTIADRDATIAGALAAFESQRVSLALQVAGIEAAIAALQQP